MDLGILLIEVDHFDTNDKDSYIVFNALSSIVSGSIGNALKVCMLSKLERVSRLFLEKMELNHRLQAIVERTQEVYGGDFQCEIFLHDSIEEKLYLKASTLVSLDQYEYYTISSNVGLNGWVLEHQ
jgi:hypothetical protein